MCMVETRWQSETSLPLGGPGFVGKMECLASPFNNSRFCQGCGGGHIQALGRTGTLAVLDLWVPEVPILQGTIDLESPNKDRGSSRLTIHTRL